MGIDAVAILRIARLPEPRTRFGNHPVTHRGDATLINTMVGFDSCEPDEHALGLRHLVGPALDAHDDPRGILFFPDVGGYPKTDNYAAMVREKEHGGVWAPMVAADYLPARYDRAGTHDGLIGEMIAVMGRKAALELAILTEMRRVTVATSTPGDPEAAAAYQASLDDITAAMGAEFAGRFDKSVTGKIEAWIRAAAGR